MEVELDTLELIEILVYLKGGIKTQSNVLKAYKNSKLPISRFDLDSMKFSAKLYSKIHKAYWLS